MQINNNITSDKGWPPTISFWTPKKPKLVKIYGQISENFFRCGPASFGLLFSLFR